MRGISINNSPVVLQLNGGKSACPQAQMAHSKGFTLVELMVTIAVMAIIASIAVPSFSNQLARQRVKSAAVTIESAMKEAKTESYLRKRAVTVTYASADNTLTLEDADGNQVAQYTLNSQSQITLTPASQTAVSFTNGRRAQVVAYTVCDSSVNDLTPTQITVDAIANITSITSGTCP